MPKLDDYPTKSPSRFEFWPNRVRRKNGHSEQETTDDRMLEAFANLAHIFEGRLAAILHEIKSRGGATPNSFPMGIENENTDKLAAAIQRIADHFDPPKPATVTSSYVAERLGRSVRWIGELARKAKFQNRAFALVRVTESIGDFGKTESTNGSRRGN